MITNLKKYYDFTFYSIGGHPYKIECRSKKNSAELMCDIIISILESEDSSILYKKYANCLIHENNDSHGEYSIIKNETSGVKEIEIVWMRNYPAALCVKCFNNEELYLNMCFLTEDLNGYRRRKYEWLIYSDVNKYSDEEEKDIIRLIRQAERSQIPEVIHWAWSMWDYVGVLYEQFDRLDVQYMNINIHTMSVSEMNNNHKTLEYLMDGGIYQAYIKYRKEFLVDSEKYDYSSGYFWEQNYNIIEWARRMFVLNRALLFCLSKKNENND